MIQPMLTTILDLESIWVHPDDLAVYEEEAGEGAALIAQSGVLVRPIVVWQKDFETWVAAETEANYIALASVHELYETGQHDDKVTCIVAPDREVAELFCIQLGDSN